MKFFINSLVIMFGLSYFFTIEKDIYLQNCFEKKVVQSEYCNYLNNLEEAVISKSNDGIRYFNNKGFDHL